MCDSDKEVEDIKTEENVDYLKSIFNYFFKPTFYFTSVA